MNKCGHLTLGTTSSAEVGNVIGELSKQVVSSQKQPYINKKCSPACAYKQSCNSKQARMGRYCWEIYNNKPICDAYTSETA